jgi:hypothetical protein
VRNELHEYDQDEDPSDRMVSQDVFTYRKVPVAIGQGGPRRPVGCAILFPLQLGLWKPFSSVEGDCAHLNLPTVAMMDQYKYFFVWLFTFSQAFYLVVYFCRGLLLGPSFSQW